MFKSLASSLPLLVLVACAAEPAESAPTSVDDELVTVTGLDGPKALAATPERLFWIASGSVLFTQPTPTTSASATSGMGSTWWWSWWTGGRGVGASASRATELLRGVGNGVYYEKVYAVDGETVYANVAGKLVRVAASGADRVTYPFELPKVERLAVDGASVYVVGESTVHRVAKDFGSRAVKLFDAAACAGPDSGMEAFEQDATSLYLECRNRLVRISKSSGVAKDLLKPAGTIYSLAVGGDAAYVIRESAAVSHPRELLSVPLRGAAATVLREDVGEARQVRAAGDDLVLWSGNQMSRFRLATRQTSPIGTWWSIKALSDVFVNGDVVWYAEGNTYRAANGAWPGADRPGTGTIGYERLR